MIITTLFSHILQNLEGRLLKDDVKLKFYKIKPVVLIYSSSRPVTENTFRYVFLTKPHTSIRQVK